MKFYVDYFGCRTNQAETQEWIIDLEEAGYQLTSNLSEANFGILNTCSVTERAEKDIFKFINRMYKNTGIKWIIAGCTVSKEKQHLRGKYKNYYFYDNKEKQTLVERIKALFPVNDNIIYHSAYRSRVFLKIHDGCNFRCSFCIVPFLRGKSVSIPSADIIKKAKYYTSLGYREIVLTGINLSSYGYDLFPSENLLDLIKEIARIRRVDFIRLSSLDPRYIKYDFLREISYIKKMADSFHFSFQSGSNSVLRRMKRGSRTDEYAKILEDFQHFFPEANLGADILVGFPGETDREFRETLNFVTESRLTYTHIFPFSPRKGTKAALMEQLPHTVIQKRAAELREIDKMKRMNYRERFIGRVLEGILTEEDPNYSLIVTRNYLYVRVPPMKGYKKKKVRVKIHGILNENLCEGTVIGR
jgi:threonylcarbamoyladenosine tRNA methylthiotransferase MtaB